MLVVTKRRKTSKKAKKKTSRPKRKAVRKKAKPAKRKAKPKTKAKPKAKRKAKPKGKAKVRAKAKVQPAAPVKPAAVKRVQIGKVSHYYNKINVAVVDLTANLNVGDRIEIERGEGSFDQVVDSMQVEYESVQTARSGQAIGLKVDQPVRENNTVYKLG